MSQRPGFQSLAVRAGQKRSSFGEQSEPIFTSSSYVFESAQQAADRFSGEDPGYIYSRFTNPTIDAFQDRMAALEEGDSCVATSSGMAAIFAACMGICSAGDHVVYSQSIFGTTSVLFEKFLPRYGVDTSSVVLTELDAWQNAIKKNTRLFYVETPSNPLLQLIDIRQLAELAHAHGILLIVDNCLCTPALQKPLKLGADIVINSATKYIDGQGRALGGVVVGPHDLVGEQVYGFLRTTGPCISPFNAWVLLKAMETLKIRMQAHCQNAMQIAQWLNHHPAVEHVYYPGLPTHPQHQLAQQQQSGFGGIVAFEVKGQRQAAWSVIDATRMVSITANLGDAKTTITHPATTTHGRLSQAQRDQAGIKDNLVRVAVGLEEADDIQADLACGLDHLAGS